jgi:hypothetical protein|uniref:Uncharacterized protein n=1 Tax=Amanita brunnescens TaxID=87326 RepID=A0A5Q0N300_AMABU|nr:hypothetical protein [Amanita brunnescens]QFZ98589.1 hypothetical protein [Amanita brunnescens]
MKTKNIVTLIYFIYNKLVLLDKNNKLDYLSFLFVVVLILHNTELIIFNTELIIKPIQCFIIDRGLARLIIKLVKIEDYLNIKIKYFSNEQYNRISEYLIIIFKIFILPYIIYKLYLKCINDLSLILLFISLILYCILAIYINSMVPKKK